MAEVIDIIHRLSYQVADEELQKATGTLVSQLTKIGELEAAVRLLNKEMKTATDPSRIQAINKEIAEYERRIKALTTAVNTQIIADGKLEKALIAEIGLIQTLSKEIVILQIERSKLSNGTQRAIQLDFQLAATQNRLATALRTTNQSSAALGKGFNNLSFAGSQLLREAPAFVYSIQTGILALSNNIPILVDQMQAAKAAGQSNAQVWRALGMSLFSISGIITVAVTALTFLSKGFGETSKSAKEASGSIDSVVAALDKYAKMWEGVADKNDEGTKALKRNIEAMKAQGVIAGEIYEAERRAFEGDQSVRQKEKEDLEDRIKIYERIRQAVVNSTRGRGVNSSEEFARQVSGLPAGDREQLISAFNNQTLTRRSIGEKILALEEDLKDKSNQITVSEVEFNSKQREKEYQLRVELSKRISENELEFSKLRLERGTETFEKIQQLNKLELQENEEKLNQEIDAARKAGTLSVQVLEQYEEIRLQIRRQANEKLLQENLDFFEKEREDLQVVVSGLGSIFGDKPDAAPKKAEAGSLNDANDAIKRRLKRQEDAAKRDKQIIDESLNYAYNTTIQTLQSIYDAQLFYLDKEIALRRERVDQAVLLAEKGNTDILAAEQDRLRKTEEERERVAERQLQLNALLQASSAAIAATQAIQVVTNAGATGDPYSTAARIAAAVAALAAGFAFVTSLTSAFKFKDGVIGLDGPGSETSDSIPARLSRGESVMTAAETKEFRPYLEAMREGTFYNMIANTAQPVFVQGNNYGKLEKKLDGVIAAVEGIHISANQRMDKNGLSQLIESTTRQQTNRWR